MGILKPPDMLGYPFRSCSPRLAYFPTRRFLPDLDAVEARTAVFFRWKPLRAVQQDFRFEFGLFPQFRGRWPLPPTGTSVCLLLLQLPIERFFQLKLDLLGEIIHPGRNWPEMLDGHAVFSL